MRKVPISRKWGIHVEEVRYHFGASLVLSIISGKWKPPIICELDEGARRYNELHEQLNQHNAHPISQKVLTEQLRQLEEDLIVTRTSYNTVPPKVVYSLTPYGSRLHQFLVEMTKLGEKLAPHLAKAGAPIEFDYHYQDMIHH